MPQLPKLNLWFFALFLLVLMALGLYHYSTLVHHLKLYNMVETDLHQANSESTALYKKLGIISLILKLDQDASFLKRDKVFQYEFHRGRILHFHQGLFSQDDIQKLASGVQLGKSVFPIRSEAIFPGSLDLDTFLNPGLTPRILHSGYKNSGPIAWTTNAQQNHIKFTVFCLDLWTEDELTTELYTWLQEQKIFFYLSHGQYIFGLIWPLLISLIIWLPLQKLYQSKIVPAFRFRLYSRPLLISGICLFLSVILLFIIISLNQFLFQFQILRNEELLAAEIVDKSSLEIIQGLENLSAPLTDAISSGGSNFHSVDIGYFLFDANGNVSTNVGQIQEILFVKLAKNIVDAVLPLEPTHTDFLTNKLEKRLHEALVFLRIEKTANIVFGMDRLITASNRDRLIAIDWGSQSVFFWYGLIPGEPNQYFIAFVTRQQIYPYLFKHQRINSQRTFDVFLKDTPIVLSQTPSNTQFSVKSNIVPELSYRVNLNDTLILEKQNEHLQDLITYGVLIGVICFCFCLIYTYRTTWLLYHVKSVSEAVLNQKALAKFDLKIRDEFFVLLQTVHACESELKQKQSLTPFVAQKLLKLLTREDGSLNQKFSGMATIVFSDIRSFTTISESESAENIVTMLNEYFDLWQTSVDYFGGITERFIGDAIVIVFPSALDPHHAQTAVDCSLRLLDKLNKLNHDRRNRQQFLIQNGIGIASGPITTKIIGTSSKRHLVSIGDCVELAETLEALTKTHQTSLLCDQTTKELTEYNFNWTCVVPTEGIHKLDQEMPSGN